MDLRSPHTTRDPGLESVHADIAASLPALSAIVHQLQQTSELIEKSVTDVCTRFQSMASRVQENVDQTRRILGADEAQTESDCAKNMHGLISSIRTAMLRVESSGQASQRGEHKIEVMQKQMAEIQKHMDQTGEIFTELNVLGLNALIEAARAGQHGRTFAVVAGKTRELGTMAAQVSKASQETVKQMSARVGEVRDVFQLVTSASGEVRAEVDGVLALLNSGHEELRRSIEDSARSSQVLAGDIKAAVMALQFQDRVSQQIAHVVETVEEIRSYLAGRAAAGSDAATLSANRAGVDWTQGILARCTMRSEREVVGAHLAERAGSPAPCDNDIEIF